MKSRTLFVSTAALLLAATPMFASAADTAAGAKQSTGIEARQDAAPKTGATMGGDKPALNSDTAADAEVDKGVPAVSLGDNELVEISKLREVDGDESTATWNNMKVADLKKMDIVDVKGDEVGDVDDVLVGPSGEIAAVTADIGGFLGIGATEVVLKLDQTEVSDGKLKTRLTEAQLEKLPRWKDD